MIELTTVKGEVFTLNADQILRIENSGPDTLIECTNGNRLRVKETPPEIVDRTLKWQQKRWIPLV